MKTCYFNVGDRVKPTSGPYRRTEFTVTGITEKGDRVSCSSEKGDRVFPAKLLKFAPKAKTRVGHPQPIAKTEVEGVAASPIGHPTPALKVGDTVFFEQYWNGARRPFEGRIAKLNEPVGTAIVQFEIPETDETEGLKELQALISLFSLFRPKQTEVIEAEIIRTEIAKIKAAGIAPDNCWIDWKPQDGGFVQWVWRSTKPMFQSIRGGGLVKTSYIKGPEALKEAKAAIERRNEVRRLEKRLILLEKEYGCKVPYAIAKAAFRDRPFDHTNYDLTELNTINIGAKFRHYKGEVVTVIGMDVVLFPIAKGEVVEWSQEPCATATDNIIDGELIVFYTADSKKLWARPLRIFREKIEGLGCDRFGLLNDV